MPEEKSSTNVWWYVVLLFIIVVFVSLIQVFSSAMLFNPDINASLTDETRDYIFAINCPECLDLSEYSVTTAQIENAGLTRDTNDTGAQAKDYALEFFYSRSQASSIFVIAKNVFSIPEFFIILLKIPQNSIAWLIGLLNWFWRLGMLVATYYFIRGIK